MANRNIFGLPEKKKKLNSTASSMASEYGEELVGRKIADISEDAGRSVANGVANAGLTASERGPMPKANKDDVPSINRIKYRLDPFHIMDGDIERVKRQTNIERNAVAYPREIPNNRVDEPKKKKEE